MAKRQTQRKSNKRPRYFTDEEKGIQNLPPNMGTGANIRFITPAGDVVQSNPREYRKLGKGQKEAVIDGIMAALGRAA